MSDRDARVLMEAGGGVLVTRALDADLAERAVYALPAADALILLDTPSPSPSRHEHPPCIHIARPMPD